MFCARSGMSKGVRGGILVPPVLFSEQAGHEAYTLTIDLTVDPDSDSDSSSE
jgi:hypothetical protein